jgi:CRISPR-associated protein Cas2
VTDMMVLISYDVSTSDIEGKKRLRKIAKECQNHAQRVQNSVFEADLDYGKFLQLKNRLIKMINRKQDSLRFYYLGNNWEKKIEHIGAKQTYNSEGVIII